MIINDGLRPPPPLPTRRRPALALLSARAAAI
jgi:hypothetical protein